MWATTQTLGLSEITLRLPSVIAGMVLVLVSGLIVWRWSASGSLGVLTSFLVAIDPHSIFFAQEARVYAIVQLVALLQVASFAELAIGSANRFSRWTWIVLTWLLFYLHYTCMVLLLGEVLFGFIAIHFRWSSRPVAEWGIDLVLICVGFIPAVPHLQEIAARRDNWSKFVLAPTWTNLVSLFRLDAFVLSPMIVFGLFTAVALVRGKRCEMDRSLSRRMLLLVFWLVVPLFVAWTLTRFGALHLFFRRYLISVGVAPMILAGVLGTALPGAIDRRGFALLSATAAAALILPLHPINVDGAHGWHSVENWRAAITSINGRPELAHLPVFVCSALIEDDGLRDSNVEDELVEFCLLPVQSLYRLEARAGVVEPLPSLRSWELSEVQIERLSDAGGGWLIARTAPRDADILGERLQGWLKQNGVQVTVQADHFGNVSVLLFQIE